MSDTDGLRYTKIPLNNGSDEIPALGFGTLIPDPIATKDATKAALEVGFRQFDCAERYRNEEQVGEAMRDVFQEGKAKREDVFVGTKLWNTNHRPERVRPAFEASLRRLQLDYVDLYCIHTPFAFKPGDDQDPRDENGNVIYDDATTLTDTWKAFGEPRGRTPVQGYRIIERQSGTAERGVRIRAGKACCSSSRIPSISPSMGTARLLQEEWHRDAGPSRRWVMVSNRGYSTILSSRASPSASIKPPLKFYWHGLYNASPLL
jgi:aryl-alcohol dehydrogenase-like predicted oxidoreductase